MIELKYVDNWIIRVSYISAYNSSAVKYRFFCILSPSVRKQYNTTIINSEYNNVMGHTTLCINIIWFSGSVCIFCQWFRWRMSTTTNGGRFVVSCPRNRIELISVVHCILYDCVSLWSVDSRKLREYRICR